MESQASSKPPLAAGEPRSMLHEYLNQQQKHHQHHQHQRLDRPIKVKTTTKAASGWHAQQQLGATPGCWDQADQLRSLDQIQRKLVAFLYLYIMLIISLYLTYAIVGCYQGAASNPTGQSQSLPMPQQPALDARAGLAPNQLETGERPNEEPSAKLDAKIQLLERQLEVIALDLEQTKARLSERERCPCQLGCSFNGTQFSDGHTWQHNCDTCSCQAGKVSCAARKCPKLAAHCRPGQRATGQCCPSCMRSCRLNGAQIRHGHHFKLAGPLAATAKQCKCLDGLIKCTPALLTLGGQLRNETSRGANELT